MTLPGPQTETHPWEPFVPPGARLLIMGTFPPQPKRWAMNFYYPNRNNDFWKIMGLIFLSDPFALYNQQTKDYDLPEIKRLMTEKEIALNDTCFRIRRLKDNASDKFLDVVEPVDLKSLLGMMPDCKAIATTGEKAADILAGLTCTERPKMGTHIQTGSGLEIWRMPSTSRAYPLALEKKAEYYAAMMRHLGIL